MLTCRLAVLTRSTSTTSRSFHRLAYRVERSAIKTPRDPVHPNQAVECTWTLHTGPPTSDRRRFRRHDKVMPSRMEKLKVMTPGLTLIRVMPELLESVGRDVVAQVRVSASAAEILQSVQLAPMWPQRTLLQFCPPYAGQPLTGNLVTEIDLPHRGVLRNLMSTGHGDVVIDGDALGGDSSTDPWDCRGFRRSSVKLMALQDSRLFVEAPSSDWKIHSLQAAAAGESAQLFMDLSALEVSRSLDLASIGGYDTQVHVAVASLTAPRVRIGTIGAGSADVTVNKNARVGDMRVGCIGTGSVAVRGSIEPRSFSVARQVVNSIGTG